MASIEKRGHYWRARVRRSGYPTKTATFDTQREAKHWALEVESEMTRGVYVDRSEAERTPLKQLFKRYRETICPEHRGGDVESCRLAAWERSHPLKELPATRVTTAAVADWRDKRLKEGLAPDTVVYELALLHRVIEEARREWNIHLPENPVSQVRRPRRNSGRERRLLPGEEEALLSACRSSRNDLLEPLVILALETAARRGELLSLTWNQVDLPNRISTIALGKNGESRSLPLSPRAIETLETLQRTEDPRVLPMSANAAKLAWQRALRRARRDHEAWLEAEGLEHDGRFEGLRFHDLRHEAVSRLFEKGFQAMEVASVSGHKDLRMLRRYTHMNAKALAKKLAARESG